MDVTERNKALIRRFIETVNTGDVAHLDHFISPECIETDGKVRVKSGVAGMAEHVRGVRRTFPDLHLTVERQVAEGEWVATLVTARATHRGEWLGMAPTGKGVVITAVNLDRVVDGLLVEHGGAANMLEALLEVGALRPVGREPGR